jgi:hypothetical protein
MTPLARGLATRRARLQLAQIPERMTLLARGLATRRARLVVAQMQERMTLLVRRLAAVQEYEPISAETLRLPSDGQHLPKAIHNRQHIVACIGSIPL